MFVEIKTGSAINSLSARALADAQTRERFGDYYDATPSIFVGLSAFGHHVAQYTLNKEKNNKITPSRTLASPEHLVDVAPRQRWDVDLTTEEGGRRMLDIIQLVELVMIDEGLHNCFPTAPLMKPPLSTFITLIVARHLVAAFRRIESTLFLPLHTSEKYSPSLVCIFSNYNNETKRTKLGDDKSLL